MEYNPYAGTYIICKKGNSEVIYETLEIKNKAEFDAALGKVIQYNHENSDKRMIMRKTIMVVNINNI